MATLNIPVASYEQFEEAKEMLQKTPNVSLTTQADASKGHLATAYIDADYQYIHSTNMLQLQNVKKHGFAKLAADEIIVEHIEAMLVGLGLKVAPTPVDVRTPNPAPEAVGSGTERYTEAWDTGFAQENDPYGIGKEYITQSPNPDAAFKEEAPVHESHEVL